MLSINSVKVIINLHSGVSDKEEARRRLTKIFAASGVDFEGIDLAGAAELDAQERSAAGGGEVDRGLADRGCRSYAVSMHAQATRHVQAAHVSLLRQRRRVAAPRPAVTPV